MDNLETPLLLTGLYGLWMTPKGYGLIGTFCEPPFPFSSPHGLKMSPNILEKLNFQGTNWHGIDPSL